MLIRLSLIALCTALVLSSPMAKEKPAAATSADQVACEGVFGPQSSEQLLIDTFGAGNVVTGTVPGPEGSELFATTVFPDDPEKAMEFGWWDEDKREGLSYVQLSPSQVGPLGIHIGMTPAEVEAINGERFLIGGFWWDYGGYAMIETGKLTDIPGGCYMSLRFAPADEYSPAIDVTPVSGEVQVLSDEGLLEILDTRLQVLTLSYDSAMGD
ncbi:hypothetical protein JI749_16260 [Devosia oryziradicis]|uniref:Uncharacterized protein n=1 Tax=Devosia oryziradicis TaxID=2801335 RepID=A0ABX7BVA9_9HYPH|nr:hypothetical protein [Devosia oryziradicis]QQR35872.1 hypothetical protein JI749_16260 [Devosia oryziradicis]